MKFIDSYEWNDFTEHEPDCSRSVLIKDRSNSITKVTIGHWDDDHKMFFWLDTNSTSSHEDFCVTHWMDLPNLDTTKLFKKEK